MFASALDFPYFGFAEDTPVRQCSNKFDIVLTYSYLCRVKTKRNQFSKYVKPQITPSQGRQSPFRTPEIGFDQYDRLRENTARIDRQDLRSLFSVDGADR